MYKIGNIYVLAAIAVVGGALFGFDIASMSAILPAQSYKCFFNQAPYFQTDNNGNRVCVGPTSAVQGGISAAMPAGSWLGSLISGYLTDYLGRRKAIGIGCITWIIGSIIVASSYSIGQLCAGRVINGLCVGVASAQVPVYITELAPPTKRGRLVGLQQWAITWGILIMFYISYGTTAGLPNSTAGWRVPWGIQMIPAIFLLVALFFMPESPRWLGNKGRWEEVHQVLTLVHGKGNPNHPLVLREVEEIREIVEFEKRNTCGYLEIFNSKNINRTHIGLFTQIWSQLTGMNVMMYYISYVFQMAGKSGNALLLSSSIQYIINVVMTVPALIWMDRWGRRPTLLIGAFLMAMWLFINGGLLSTGVHHPNGYQGTREVTYTLTGSKANALIACTYLFVASYAPTWGPVSWVYPPELYPLRTRGKSVSFATSGNWAFNTALGAFVPPAFENIGYKVYFVFASFCVAMFIHVFFLFPETSGKTLEEVRLIFEDPNGAPGFGTLAWRTRNSYNSSRALEQGRAEDKRVERSSSGETSPERYVEHMEKTETVNFVHGDGTAAV